MKCIYCGEQINSSDKYEVFTLDGDFIHVKCKKPLDKEMTIISNMTDKEFENWLTGSST